MYTLPSASAERLRGWLETINTYNDTPEFGTTRVLFTPTEVAARAYVKREMEVVGLAVHEDAIGNIFGVLEGTEPALAPVWTGSHIDTVLNAGMFDGMAGVVAGMEAARLIRASGIAHRRSLCVIVFTSEEPTRFGLCCLGSRTMAGHMTEEDTKALRDQDGKTLHEVLRELGYHPAELQQIVRRKGDVYASVELHIEQSASLERSGKSVGIVRGICAPTCFNVTVTGEQSHAGGTSMADRMDAFTAASEISLLLEELGRTAHESEYTTATVGHVEVIPNASNAIPGKVKFSIDIRDCSLASKDSLIEKLKAGIRAIELKRGMRIELELQNHDTPIMCDSNIVSTIAQSCEALEIDPLPTISGAYHDSLFVGEFAPIGMIFVPSKNGISHSPEEWTEYSDIARGTDVLAQTLLTLANQ